MAAIRYSKQREAIRMYLLSTKSHPTAEAVYNNIKNEHPRISLGTVYRNLNLLVEQGILYKRRGIGMFVAPGAGQAVRASRQAAFYKRFVCPMVKEAAGLGLTVQQLNEMVARAAEEGKQ